MSLMQTFVDDVANVRLFNMNITPAEGYIGVGLRGDGDTIIYGNGSSDWTLRAYRWLIGGINSDFEVRYTQTVGAWTGDNYTMNTWSRLNNGLHMRCYTDNGVGAQVRIEIRNFHTKVVLQTCLVTRLA